MTLKKPVNPFALGGAFIEWAREKGWVEVEEVGRCRNYYITSTGVTNMNELGIRFDSLYRFTPLSEEEQVEAYKAERKKMRKASKAKNAGKR